MARNYAINSNRIPKTNRMKYALEHAGEVIITDPEWIERLKYYQPDNNFTSIDNDNNNLTMETVTTTETTNPPQKPISRTVMWARAHKWSIELLDPELQAQCKSYKDGKKIIRDEVDA